MEDDAGDHDVGSNLEIPVGFIGGCGGYTAANGLQEQGEEIDGAEDPEVLFGAQGARVPTEDMDEISEDDVDACGEEGGAENESGDLDLECCGTVGTLGSPGACYPAQEFAHGTGDEDKLPPSPRQDCLGEVCGRDDGEEDNEDYAGSERWHVAITGGIGRIKGRA